MHQGIPMLGYIVAGTLMFVKRFCAAFWQFVEWSVMGRSLQSRWRGYHRDEFQPAQLGLPARRTVGRQTRRPTDSVARELEHWYTSAGLVGADLKPAPARRPPILPKSGLSHEEPDSGQDAYTEDQGCQKKGRPVVGRASADNCQARDAHCRESD